MTIWEFLATHTVWNILLIISGAIVGVWAIVLAVVYGIKNARLKKAGAGGVEFGDKQPEQPAHANCVHGRDIVVLLKKQAEMINEVHDIKDSVIPEQMRFAESKAVELRGMLQKIFLGLLQDEADSGRIQQDKQYVEYDDYHLYRLCIRSIYEDMRDYIRVCFRENHLAVKTEAEFRIYVSTKTDEMVQKSTDLLNDLYHGKVILRSVVYSANQQHMQEIRDSIASIFGQARDIAIKAVTESTQKEQEFETYFSEKTGL